MSFEDEILSSSSVFLSRGFLILVLPLQLLSPFVLVLSRRTRLNSRLVAVALRMKYASFSSRKKTRQVLYLQG